MPSMPGNSRLKRRAQPDSHNSQFDLGLDTSYEDERKTQETAADIRKLYEQTKAGSNGSVTKRTRSNAHSQTAEPLDLDEEDPVQATLRKAARAKKEGKTQETQTLMPPPAQIPRRESPTEEPEEVEETIRLRKVQATPRSPSLVNKSDEGGPQLTKDDEFLRAITKASKSKKAVDELDKEFNQLRIPKPDAPGGSTVVKANVWDADHPDYTIVNDFDDELRGNFIQIIRKDLMRKDLGTAKTAKVDDGRPNFKKFTKVRETLIKEFAETVNRKMW